jgi:hypothetical protein
VNAPHRKHGISWQASFTVAALLVIVLYFIGHFHGHG